ncbi:glycosyltransferase family 9 protein [Serratia quinivorans]|uniref:glycosyltransferase family 9 protein n=1 Tax=Serratia quinivorans TaxID=137545 RepID=UPI00217C4B60|nr:glycosyltransferase family 9 protein [Serratia quinivorans]CAI1930027.1 ADP-heptose--LPS heptosyltransferase 2 [Serratia quinivorans]CAI2003725.1 ADP-heptose--LPS heptosyltransferase 2 [Serratia quinivorans]
MKIKKLKYAHWFLTVYNFLFGNIKPKSTLRPDHEFKRIVVYSTTALGDFMFNTPAMRAVRRRYPDAHITLVAGTINYGMVKDYACFDDVIFWDNKFREMRQAVAEIKKRKPELAVILHAHLPYDIISAALAGCQYILRDNYLTLPKGIDSWVHNCSLNFTGHLIQRKLNLMNFIGGDTTDVEMEIPCQFEKLPREPGKIRIGFNMGASSPERCWPVAYFSELAIRLITQHKNVEVVIIGSPADCGLESTFMSGVEPDLRSRISSYVGKTSLPQLLGVIDSLDVLVTGDTGPLHLGVALKVPTLSLFVTAKPRFTGPYQNRELHQVIDLSDDYDGTVETPLAIIPVTRVYTMLENMRIISASQ